MSGPDRDLFGDLIVPAPEVPAYMRDQPRAENLRLFEPQFEGQLALAETPSKED